MRRRRRLDQAELSTTPSVTKIYVLTIAVAAAAEFIHVIIAQRRLLINSSTFFLITCTVNVFVE